MEMELEAVKETMGKKKGDNADEIVIQIADSKENIEVTTEHENLSISSRNQISTLKISASPVTTRVAELVEENTQLLNPPANHNNNEVTYSTAEECLESDSGEGYEEEEEEVYNNGKLKRKKPFVWIEWIAFVCFVVLLICSATLKQLQNHVLWEFKLWKWCVLALVICCGRLFANWSVNVLIFFTERQFLLRARFLYYVYGLRKIMRVFIWLALFLLARFLLFRSKETTKILNYLTRAVAASLVGAALWSLKSFSVLFLVVSFRSKRFYRPIKQNLFHQRIIHRLSGPPLWDEKVKQFEGGKKSNVIDVSKLHKIKTKKSPEISDWSMKTLMNAARSTKLSIVSTELDEWGEEDILKENLKSLEKKTEEIRTELEAVSAANKIFINVANRGCSYVSKEDLNRFLIMEEVEILLTKFEGAEENGKIQQLEFKQWVLKVFNEHKALSHFIQQSKAATDELNRLFNGIVIVVIIILWLILMKILKTEALVFIISQLLLAAFMFGNTVKNIFESVIFLYVMHPFDVGDRCVIDEVQMVVEEIHILTTTFVRFDNEKVFYPNSVLATKPINNLYRSTGDMKDSVEFVIDPSTSNETIEALDYKIQDYLNSKPDLWRPHHNKVVVKEIEDGNKIRMVLQVTHTINFQEYGERSSRRSKLVLRLKQIFEEIGISKYHVLPQS